MIVSGGMDHRLSLVRLTSIKENNWGKAVKKNDGMYLDESGCAWLRFPQIFSTGEYNNIRTNLHGYGFADLLVLNNNFVLPTFDSKLMIYKYV